MRPFGLYRFVGLQLGLIVGDWPSFVGVSG